MIIAALEAGERAIGTVRAEVVRDDMAALDRWARTVLAQTLRETGALADGERLSAGEVVRRIGTAPRHHAVVHRWLRVLADAGMLARDPLSETYAWPRALPPQDVGRAATQVTPGPVCGEALWGFYQRAAEHLIALVRDEVRVQALLFDGDSITDDIYAENVASTFVNAAVAAVVARLAPRDVLEIGAGVGATTDGVIDALPHGVRYDFTDVSTYFLERARQRYREHPGLTASLHDLNAPVPPERMGRHDVVLAANVLHNGRDVDEVARHVLALVAPGGHLVMIETGREHHPLLLSMRLLMSPPPDRPDDVPRDQRRHDGRILLTRREWTRALVDAGFETPQTLPADGHPLDRVAQFALVARKPDRSTHG